MFNFFKHSSVQSLAAQIAKARSTLLENEVSIPTITEVSVCFGIFGVKYGASRQFYLQQ
jgi:hypothetical protein